jgi:hypothetical protein
MAYLGDYSEDYATLNFRFSSRTTTGVPTTLAGVPVLSIYPAGSHAPITAGITLVADFDAVTGLNDVIVDLSADAGYAAGKDYSVVITTGTVGGVSVVGEVVAQFSIENRKALISTRAQDLSGTLDVNAKKLNGAAPNNLAAGAQMDLVNVPNGTAITAFLTAFQAAGTMLKAIDDLTKAAGAGDLAAVRTAAVAIDTLTKALGPGDLAALKLLAVTNLNATVGSRSSHSAADSADAVWNEAAADHVAAGSTGAKLGASGSQVDMSSGDTDITSE